MSDKLTPLQYRTLSIIDRHPGGQTMLLPIYWRDRHHQALIKRGFLRLRTNPFKTKAHMLYGNITARGRNAVRGVSDSVRNQAKAAADRDYERYAREAEAGFHE